MSDSMLRKGKTSAAGAYTYVCGCGFKDSDCAYCCGGDLKRCQDAIKTARGQIYYGLLKTILRHVGKAMYDEAKRLRDSDETLTVVDIGWISRKYDLNFKATCEWLEEIVAIRTGTYARIKSGGLKVADIMAAAEQIAVCHERGRHEWYIGDGGARTCRQCGKTIKVKRPIELEGN